MNQLILAIKRTIRSPARTIILICTFFIIGNLIFVGTGIYQTSKKAKEAIRTKLDATVVYQLDDDKYREYEQTLSEEESIEKYFSRYKKSLIPIETVLKMAEDDRVETYNYLSSQIVQLIGVTPIMKETNSSGNITFDFNAIGNRDGDMIELHNGTIEVVDGRFYTKEEVENHERVVLISDRVAEENNLRIGDTVLVSYFMDEESQNVLNEQERFLEMEIIGLYHTNKESEGYVPFYYCNPENELYMPSTTLVDYCIACYNKVMVDHYLKEVWNEYTEGQEQQEEDFYEDAVYMLKDPEEVEQFTQDYSDVLNEYTLFKVNNQTYEALAEPLENMESIMKTATLFIIAIASVIISLVTLLSFKTRQKEIGIMLSMGIKKPLIIFQMLAEMLIVAWIGILLSMPSGYKITDEMNKRITDTQVSQSEEIVALDSEYFKSVSQQEVYADYTTDFSLAMAVEIVGMGTLIVLISILVPSLLITRLDPKKILYQSEE